MARMNFKFFEGIQLTPEWFERRRGKVSSSRLEDWLATSKAKGKEGQPLKARIDYEKELMFERQFDVNYDNFVNDAMQDGIDYEAFARQEYERITGNSVKQVGGWYNKYFFASTDGEVTKKGCKNPTGILEIKWLRDNAWTDVLDKGEPKWGHFLQMQGGMLASKHKWCDYVAGNLNTKKLIIMRVKADEEVIERIKESLRVKLSVKPFDTKKVYDFSVPALREDEMVQELSGTEASRDIQEIGF